MGKYILFIPEHFPSKLNKMKEQGGNYKILHGDEYT